MPTFGVVCEICSYKRPCPPRPGPAEEGQVDSRCGTALTAPVKAGSKPRLLGGLWVDSTTAVVRGAVIPRRALQPRLASCAPHGDVGAWGRDSRRLLGGKGKLLLSSDFFKLRGRPLCSDLIDARCFLHVHCSLNS